jgi:hypothetical protein
MNEVFLSAARGRAFPTWYYRDASLIRNITPLDGLSVFGGAGQGLPDEVHLAHLAPR